MVDRQKVETILIRRFPGAGRQQVAAAANAIMGLSDEWEEVVHPDDELGCHVPAACTGACYLASELDESAEFRLFRRRES